MPRAHGRSDVRPRPLDVVVVDDHADSCEMMQELLEAHGCVARTASSALAALDEVHRRKPDVLVTDLRLVGGAAGWTLAAALREDPATSAIGLVAVSGIVDPEWKIVRSFDAYLRKPLDLRLFVEVVHHVGGRAGVARRRAR